MVDIAAELDRVITGRKRHGVSKLSSSFVRKTRALEELRYAESEAVSNERLGRPDADGGSWLTGFRQLAKLVLKILSVLETALIDQPRGQGRCQTNIKVSGPDKVIAKIGIGSLVDCLRLNARR